MQEKKFSYRRLMFTTFVISGCSMVYELLISLSELLSLGDSIFAADYQGLYVKGRIRSYLSKFIKVQLFDWFIFVEIGVGILGGTSSILLFLANVIFRKLFPCNVQRNYSDRCSGRSGNSFDQNY